MSVFTVAEVPTGKNSGVSALPWSVVMTPQRAELSLSLAVTRNIVVYLFSSFDLSTTMIFFISILPNQLVK